VRDIDGTEEQRIKGWERRAQAQDRHKPRRHRDRSENKLGILMKRVIDSDYDSIEELVASSGICSIGEIHAFLNHIVAAWTANELTPAAMYASLKFAFMYLEQLRIKSRFKNRSPIPICYFSSYLSPSALLLHSYLKSLSFNVAPFSLAKTDQHLIEFIKKERPPAVIFTISQFLHIEPLRQLVPHLHHRNLWIFIGGVPFVYDENLKGEFSGCIFPHDLNELTLLLENSPRRNTDAEIDCRCSDLCIHA